MIIYKIFKVCKKLIICKIKLLLTKGKMNRKTNFWIRKYLHLSNQLIRHKNKILLMKNNKIKTLQKQSKVRVLPVEHLPNSHNLNKVSKINKIYAVQFPKKSLLNKILSSLVKQIKNLTIVWQNLLSLQKQVILLKTQTNKIKILSLFYHTLGNIDVHTFLQLQMAMELMESWFQNMSKIFWLRKLKVRLSILLIRLRLIKELLIVQKLRNSWIKVF
jgi:hypothetical protein